jgi:hypothetical protein
MESSGWPDFAGILTGGQLEERPVGPSADASSASETGNEAKKNEDKKTALVDVASA